MNWKSRPRVRACIVAALLLLLWVTAIGQGSWGLGPYQFYSGEPSGPLQVNQSKAGGLGAYPFVSGVGGVAFTTVAMAGPALKDKRISLHYVSTEPDGMRLQVTSGDLTSDAVLPDWMLVPIAGFADSEYDSCVSLFGPKTTAKAYDIVYHEKFQNTLLGLRLLQADFLLFNVNETWQLPKWNGMLILGLGETAPAALDESSAEEISSAMEKGEFQSWVMTDRDENITFDIQEGHLEISGEPYYYFWNSDAARIEGEREPLIARAQALRKAGRIAEHNRLVEQINAMVPAVTEVSALTEGLKSHRGALRRFNPPVYNAAANTMRFSAFFRYVKAQDPEGWKGFLRELSAAAVEPKVTTPTRWAR